MTKKSLESGKVYLVGAGPGDPELMTVKAMRVLALADVVVHDRLVSDEVLALAPRTAARLSVGKAPGSHPIPQQEINRLLVRLAGGGLTVVRLKGGDPFVFGRGGEEVEALVRAGIACEVVPGITAAQGCAAAARIPLTHRGLASGLRYVTGHCKADEPLDLDWAGLADPETTLVVYMGVAQIRLIAARLIEHGLPAALPVLAIANGTRPEQRQLATTLGDVAEAVADAGFANPVCFLVGRVAGLEIDARDEEPVELHLVAETKELRRHA